ncbi:MAG: hypothetical protein H6654_17640 [Ardenticatenaceae bacterium]|nr:hypothetical protein [Ardenticatenaceae bacterium]
MNISVGSGGIQGNISQRSAYWVSQDTIAWDIEDAPATNTSSITIRWEAHSRLASMAFLAATPCRSPLIPTA